MAKRTTQKDRAFQQVSELIQVNAIGSNQLLIVNSTILKSIVEALPEESLAKLLAKELVSPTAPVDLPLASWVKTAREQTGLSHRAFAKLLRTKGLKVSGSDIGNLESGYRTSNYRPQRIEKIKTAISEILKTINPPKERQNS